MKQKLLQLRNLVDECLLEIDKITNESSQHENPVIRFVCKKHALSVDSLINSRAYHIVRARREAIWLMRIVNTTNDIIKLFDLSRQGVENALDSFYDEVDLEQRNILQKEYNENNPS